MALRARMGLATPVVRFMWQPRMGWLLSGKPQKGEAGEEMFRNRNMREIRDCPPRGA